MKDEFQIVAKEIERNILHFEANGVVYAPIANHKLRILAVFTRKETVRRFPMEAVCRDGDGKTIFEVKEKISLSDIFYPQPEETGENTEVSFEYCDADGIWRAFDEVLSIEEQYFVWTPDRESAGKRVLRKLAYAGFTLLLPIWVIDGYLAVKGYKKSAYLTSEMHGKKGIFYHAQGIVKKHTGYGYSVREIKTNYFAKAYGKACRKIKTPDGILFLSEREADKGGNLDLIRSGVQEEGLVWREFMDTRPIHKLSFREIRKAAGMAAGAKVIVLEDFYPQIHALTLRRETKLLQLWHACGAFKMFGLSDIGKVSNLHQDTKNHRSYWAAFVSGTHMIPFYSEAFGISPDQVLPLGVPRTDIFFDERYKEEVRERLFESYPVLKEKRVVLFAPTFRGSGKKTAYYPRERFKTDAFLENLPEDTVLVIKNHPFVRERFSYDEKYADRVLDLTGRENINDVLFITSLLITDYSSCIFEAALLSIPMLFYVFDLEEYVNGRDIYFDFASFAPGSQVQEFSELLQETERLLKEGQKAKDEKRQEFCEYFLNSIDGHSTERILEYIKTLV